MNDITLAGNARHGRRSAPAEPGSAIAGSTALVVLGMHRSGTSALTGTLHHLGVALGSRLMAATPDNPRGYWEHSDIVAVHERLMMALGYGWDDIRSLPPGFEHGEAAQAARRELAVIVNREFTGAPLWGVKDPRLCRLMPLWAEIFAEERVEPRYLLAVRHPLDVAESLAVRDGMSLARGMLLWLGHLLDAERATRGAKRVIVHYEDLDRRIGLARRRRSGRKSNCGSTWPQIGRGGGSGGRCLSRARTAPPPDQRRRRRGERQARRLGRLGLCGVPRRRTASR